MSRRTRSCSYARFPAQSQFRLLLVISFMGLTFLFFQSLSRRFQPHDLKFAKLSLQRSVLLVPFSESTTARIRVSAFGRLSPSYFVSYMLVNRQECVIQYISVFNSTGLSSVFDIDQVDLRLPPAAPLPRSGFHSRVPLSGAFTVLFLTATPTDVQPTRRRRTSWKDLRPHLNASRTHGNVVFVLPVFATSRPAPLKRPQPSPNDNDGERREIGLVMGYDVRYVLTMLSNDYSRIATLPLQSRSPDGEIFD